jgi:hypothetical protein
MEIHVIYRMTIMIMLKVNSFIYLPQINYLDSDTSDFNFLFHLSHYTS